MANVSDLSKANALMSVLIEIPARESNNKIKD